MGLKVNLTSLLPEKSTMWVGTFSGVTSGGIVISSALAGTCQQQHKDNIKVYITKPFK